MCVLVRMHVCMEIVTTSLWAIGIAVVHLHETESGSRNFVHYLCLYKCFAT